MKKTLITLASIPFSILLTLLLAEGVLRLKNQDMKNYDIEMWRYAKELKTASLLPNLGHEHLLSKTAVLQGVEIRTNEWGLRGGPVAERKAGERRILFLGSSITLGWGVKEEETAAARVEKMLQAEGQNATVLNAGIGNYNSERYVERFFTRLKDLKPTDIVVQYFLRDAEALEAGRGNWFLKNSELAVTLWNVVQRLQASKEKGTGVLEEHYQRVYDPTAPGYLSMKESLKKLSDYARAKGIRLYLAMTPDVHNLKNYPFGSIHAQVAGLAKELGYSFTDLLPSLQGLSPEEVWSMPGDPHPNALGHQKMAEALYSFLK